MPDPRRLYRRITESNLPARVVAHLTVVSIVAVASLAGLAQHDGASGSSGAESGFMPFVSTVRGADEKEQLATSFHDLSALSEEQTALVDRAAPATVPTDPGPKPTPVPVDPNATPLPAPSTGTVTTAATQSPVVTQSEAATPGQAVTQSEAAAPGQAVTQSEAAPQGQAAPQGTSSRAAEPAPAAWRLFWPVPGGSISQYFHAGHLALDIAAPYGAQVLASQAGVITWAGWRNNGGGYVIAIDHGNGMRTTYNHLGGIWVSPGQWVGAGQGIGSVGCTGICTGPHVHFEVVVNGVIDNPLRHF